jgi:hypothetical protein
MSPDTRLRVARLCRVAAEHMRSADRTLNGIATESREIAEAIEAIPGQDEINVIARRLKGLARMCELPDPAECAPSLDAASLAALGDEMRDEFGW